MSHDGRTRILILGGGFGGLYAAMRLEHTLARHPHIEITLINRDNFFLFTPMLHEIAACDLDITHIVNPVHKMLRRVNFFPGDVEAIDLPGKRVVVAHGFERHTHELAYDHVILGLGSMTNFFNIPGLQERAVTMKSLGDAIALRNRLIALLEEANAGCCANPAPLLTCVVAGGGFAGVETIAGINDFARAALKFYPHLSPDLLRMVLVHPGPVILPELNPKLGTYAQQKLTERKVEVRVNTRVAGVSEHGVALSDGTTLAADTLVWTAGTTPCPLLATLPCQKEHGRVLVNEYLEVPEWPGVWALGDCARVPDRKTGKYYPPTAQHALRQGKILAHNLRAAVQAGHKKPFVFSTLGQLATIGRRTGVANILGINFSGFIAWWLWRTIYLSKLPGFEKKVRVALDWPLDLLFSKDLVQFMMVCAPTVSQRENGAYTPAPTTVAPEPARRAP
jgi:NADH:quinone reductase (non-electrogenic)